MDGRFVFRVDDGARCMQRMNEIHAQARAHNPDARLPEAVFLRDR